jgi:hypothetical protein
MATEEYGWWGGGVDEEAGQHKEHKDHEERVHGATLHSACSLASRAAGVSHSRELRTKVPGILKLQWEWGDAGVVPVLPRVL